MTGFEVVEGICDSVSIHIPRVGDDKKFIV